MPTREHVLRLLRDGRSHQDVGRELGLPAGQVYLIATGMPADGGEVARAGEEPPGYLASPQHLVHPRVANPTAREVVHAWMARRAADERR